MATVRSNRPGDGRNAKQDGRKDAPERRGADQEDPAVVEARELLAQLGDDLQTLTIYLAEETDTLRRKGSSPKRAARLRLVAEDVASAARLARKALK